MFLSFPLLKIRWRNQIEFKIAKGGICPQVNLNSLFQGNLSTEELGTSIRSQLESEIKAQDMQERESLLQKA
jgi:hypothetical protein